MHKRTRPDYISCGVNGVPSFGVAGGAGTVPLGGSAVLPSFLFAVSGRPPPPPPFAVVVVGRGGGSAEELFDLVSRRFRFGACRPRDRRRTAICGNT